MQIEEVSRLYGDFAVGPKVKICPNEDLGFLRITVERPLRLRWEVSDETLRVAFAAKAIQKLPADTQKAIRELLEEERGASFATQQELVEAFADAAGVLELGASAEKALWAALAVRDESAPMVVDSDGNAQPDPELRDSENVPLPAGALSFEEDLAERLGTPRFKTAVEDYMRDEVLPHVPDAWVDHSRTKIGYEIPLTRYFYKYAPPRPLREIDADLKKLENEIQQLIDEVAR